MRINHVSDDAPARAVRILVADDSVGFRRPFAALLEETIELASVIEAADGAEAIELGRQRHVEIAVLDLQMPHLDGVAAAFGLCALEPCPRVALHSSDPELLRLRAAGLGLPLFDKADLDPMLGWLKRQATEVRAADHNGMANVAQLARRVDLCCSRCGYGICCRTPPRRCPMCGIDAQWIEPPARRATLHEGLAC